SAPAQLGTIGSQRKGYRMGAGPWTFDGPPRKRKACTKGCNDSHRSFCTFHPLFQLKGSSKGRTLEDYLPRNAGAGPEGARNTQLRKQQSRTSDTPCPTCF